MDRGLAGAVLLALLAFLALVVVPVAAGATTPTAATTGATTNDSVATTGTAAGAGPDALDRIYYLALTPDDPGVVRVRVEFVVPEDVSALTATVPGDATVRGTRGFRQHTERKYDWTRTTQRPTITYRWPVNRTVDRGRESSGSGGYLFVDAGPWAVLRAPNVRVTYSGTDERLELVDAVEINGSGATGGRIVYLGEYEEHTAEAAGQRFRLVVPAAAEETPPPADVLASVGTLAERNVGPRDPEVFVVAAPTTVEWGSTGLQIDPGDAWVRDAQRLDSPNNVWLHEYIHTRQVYRAEPETRWTVEGMAEYYAALGALDQRRIEYGAFRRHLRMGTKATYDDVVLADPDTWQGTLAKYRKGSLVMAAIDRQVRLATDGQRTLGDVLVRVNRKGTLSQTAFLDAVEAVAGPEVREYARRYTETSATPNTWNRSRHAEAFGLPVLRYEFASFRVTGPGRKGRATFEELPTLEPGDRLTVRIRVENRGTEPGEYRATLTRGVRVVGTRSGTLAPGESTVLVYRTTFDAPTRTSLRLQGIEGTESVQRGVTVRFEDSGSGESAATTTGSRGATGRDRTPRRTGTDAPGFGFGTALVALALVAGVVTGVRRLRARC